MSSTDIEKLEQLLEDFEIESTTTKTEKGHSVEIPGESAGHYTLIEFDDEGNFHGWGAYEW